MRTIIKTASIVCIFTLFLGGPPAARSVQDAPASRGADITLDDGTRQGFTVGVDSEGGLHSLELHQSPVDAENAAVAAILIASIADGKPGHVLHLRLLPYVQPGESGSWNLSAMLRKAVQDGRFPAALPPYGRLTVQFLRKSGDIVGPPLSAGEVLKLAGIPAQSEETRYSSSCGGLDCFEARFAKCKKETLTVTYRSGEVYEYEIIGKEGERCAVRSGFLSHPDQNWVGREMRCLLDREKPFLKAVEDHSSCNGPLNELMSGT